MGDLTKSVFASKTVWASLAGLLATILAILLKLSPAQQADATGVILQGITAIGALVALYGRITAKHALTFNGQPLQTKE